MLANTLNAAEQPSSRHQPQRAIRRQAGGPASACSTPRIPTAESSVRAGRKSNKYAVLPLKKRQRVNAQAANSENTAARNQRKAETSVADRPLHARGAARASHTRGELLSIPQ